MGGLKGSRERRASRAPAAHGFHLTEAALAPPEREDHDPSALDRWYGAPTWLVGLVAGALFGLPLGVLFEVQDGSWLAALVGAGVAGALYGAVMGPFLVRHRRRAQAAVGGGDEALRAAVRSLRWRAGEPRDERERLARLRLAQHHLQVLEGQKVWGTAVFVVLSLLAAWNALTRSPWWWLAVALFAVALVLTRLQRRRLRRIVAGG